MAGAISFLQRTSITTDLTTYTWTAEPIGTAAADRYVFVDVHARATGATALSISSASIGGVSATIIRSLTDSNISTNASVIGCIYALVPTGTTGDVVVTFSRGCVRAAIGSYRVTGMLGSFTPYDSSISKVTDPTYALDIPDNAFVIAAANFGANGSTAWTNLTETYDGTSETAFNHTGAMDTFASAESNRSITANSSSTDTDPLGFFASWSFDSLSGVTTNNGKLALINMGMPFQPNVYMVSVSTIDQADKQTFLWGYPEELWTAGVAEATGVKRLLTLGVGG